MEGAPIDDAVCVLDKDAVTMVKLCPNFKCNLSSILQVDISLDDFLDLSFAPRGRILCWSVIRPERVSSCPSGPRPRPWSHRSHVSLRYWSTLLQSSVQSLMAPGKRSA